MSYRLSIDGGHRGTCGTGALRAETDQADKIKLGLMLRRLRRSFGNSAGTIVFGMEDGTVSIFGLIFGVAATTNNPKIVLIAGASGAMAGAYLDIETTRDKAKASRLSMPSPAEAAASLPPRLTKAGLTQRQADALGLGQK